MARPLVYDTGMICHVGLVRQVNEDSFLIRPGKGLWVVADGMGGHDSGRLASTTVVECLDGVEPADTASDLLAACELGLMRANSILRETARRRHVLAIGSTVVLLLVHERVFAAVWSGDSRLYRVRGEAIAQITRDHSEAAELLARGIVSEEEARHWPRRNVITRAIGVREAPELEIVDGEIAPDDIFVLCSDGLTTHMEDDEIRREVLSGDAQAAADRMLATVLDRGAKDNVTAVVVKAREREPTVVDPNGNLRRDWAPSA
ncbi:PP2C family protein-serine/threonine phosphatase [Prosthecomicrobium sp. N25]|uniref:PP2C family protein-serine/threonine phosphatase n=1 Tax=Prosthecomicrobium sp. N25 TaxID=3129254 RepID=UPI003076DF11